MSLGSTIGMTCALALLACAAPPQPGPGSETQAARPQLQAKWIAHGTEHGRTPLTARIETSSPIPAPLSVKVVAPPGASVSGAPTEFEIPAPTAATVIERELVVSFASTPPGDLLLVVDVRAPGFGMHAVDAYRFGRSAPAGPRPVPAGPDNRIGSLRLGPSVPLR